MDYEKLYNAYFMKIYSFVLLLVKNPDLAEACKETLSRRLETTEE